MVWILQENSTDYWGSRGISERAAVASLKRRRGRHQLRSDKQAALERWSCSKGKGKPFIQADISRPMVIQQMIDTVVREFGRLDILVNNAGIFEAHPMIKCSYEEWQSWRRTLDANSWAPPMPVFAAQPHMIRQAAGALSTSSRGAFRGTRNSRYHGASKEAGMNAIRSLARAWRRTTFCGYGGAWFCRNGYRLLNCWKYSEAGDAIRRQSPTTGS